MQQGDVMQSDAKVEEVLDLTPAALATSKKVSDEDTVLCINRGRRNVEETFDGRHYSIPPGKFKCRYDAAKHFQRRAIVPGTRNLAAGGYQSFIGIIRTADERQLPLDPPELTEPYTDEELRAFGEKVEAIDREASGAVDVERVPIGSAMARTLRSTSARGRAAGIDASQQATDEASANAEHVLDTPEESATREAEAEAEADGVRPQAPKRGKK
jgi:hypothetical protein